MELFHAANLEHKSGEWHTSDYPATESVAPYLDSEMWAFAQRANAIPATGPKSPLIIRSRADIHPVIRIQSKHLGNSI